MALKVFLTKAGGGCKVELNGKDISDEVAEIAIVRHAEDETTVYLKMVAQQVELETDEEVTEFKDVTSVADHYRIWQRES